jgi:hypothetical protein
MFRKKRTAAVAIPRCARAMSVCTATIVTIETSPMPIPSPAQSATRIPKVASGQRLSPR